MRGRSAPFELVFAELRDRLDQLHRDLIAAGKDPAVRDGLLLEREAADLLRTLRPEEGFGEATETVTALLYHACRFRANRETVRSVSLGELRRVLAGPAAPIDGAEPVPSCYVQLPALAIWAVLAEGPPEPVDGWFRTRSGDRLEVLAILGLRPGRGGFTAVEVAGPAPGLADREDSTELFAPIQAGTGAQAGLAAVKSDAELLELCWRVEDLG